MLTTIDISKTETNWIELFRQAKEKGLRYLITDGDQEMAEIVPKRDERILNLHPGAMVMSDDFDDPLPESFLFSETDPLNDDQQVRADQDATSLHSEMTDLEYLRTLVGKYNSGHSDTSENVKAIVGEAIMKKYGMEAHESVDR